MDNEEIKQAVKLAMNEVLNEHRNVDQETHSNDHDFIAMLKRREKKRAERWQKFITSSIGAAAVGFVTLLGWIGTLIIEAVKNGHIPKH